MFICIIKKQILLWKKYKVFKRYFGGMCSYHYRLTHCGRGHLNCLNARSRGLNNLNQLLYCVSLKIYNQFANYFCGLKVSGNTHQRP